MLLSRRREPIGAVQVILRPGRDRILRKRQQDLSVDLTVRDDIGDGSSGLALGAELRRERVDEPVSWMEMHDQLPVEEPNDGGRSLFRSAPSRSD